MKVLLLENIHPVAVEILEARGFEVELRTGSLSEDELVEALPGRPPARHPLQHPHHPARARRAPRTCWRSAASASAPTRSTWWRPRTRGIAVFNAPYSNTRSVVELVIGEIIALGAPAHREDPADARRGLGQVGQGQPRGPRPHPRHRRLRQHRHPALQPRRGARPAGHLLRHRRPARPRQRAADADPRRAARRRPTSSASTSTGGPATPASSAPSSSRR